MQANITQLVIYPVKSLQGITVSEAQCLATGLQFDREWVVVDKENQFVSQRNLPAMATIRVALTDAELILSHPEYGNCAVPLSGNSRASEVLTIWKDQSLGIDEGDAVSAWLTKVLGVFRDSPLRLLRFDPTRQRIVREKYTQTTDSSLMFADACPFLILNTASLTALNQALEQNQHLPVTMDRFRGNIVVSDIPAWQEYQANTLRINDVALRGEAPCHRCPMPGIDQQTGLTPEPKQPFDTLAALPIPEGKEGAYFGMHATFIKAHGTATSASNTPIVKASTIKVGDVLHFSD